MILYYPKYLLLLFRKRKKKELDNLVIQLLPSPSGQTASFIPLSPSHAHAPLLSFLKAISQSSDHCSPSEIEALQAQYESFFTDSSQLKMLLEMMIQVRHREAVASHKNKPDIFEKQLAFLREWHKKLNFMTRIFLVLRSPLFSSTEIDKERVEFLTTLFKDFSSYLTNVRQALELSLFAPHSKELMSAFDANSFILMTDVLPEIFYYLEMAIDIDEIKSLYGLIESMLLHYKERAALKFMQGLNEEGETVLKGGKIYSDKLYFIVIRPLFKRLNSAQAGALTDYKTLCSAVLLQYEALKSENYSDEQKKLYSILLSSMKCFHEPAIFYDDNLEMPDKEIESILKKLYFVKMLTAESLCLLQAAVLLLNSLNLRHYNANLDTLDSCKKIVEQLKIILKSAPLTLMLQRVLTILDQYLLSLESHKNSIEYELRLTKEETDKARAMIEQFSTKMDSLGNVIGAIQVAIKKDKKDKKTSVISQSLPIDTGVTKKYQLSQETLKETQKELHTLKGKMQSLREEKVHQIKLYKQLEKELEQIKVAPKMTDLESMLLQAKTTQEVLQRKLNSAEETHRSQYGILQAQMDDQEKHYKHLLTSSKNQITALEKQLDKAKKINTHLKMVSLKQTQGNITLKKQAQDEQEKQAVLYGRKIEGYDQTISVLQAQTQTLTDTSLSLKKESLSFQKQFEYYHQKCIQAHALNEIYAGQYADICQTTIMTGALLATLSASQGVSDPITVIPSEDDILIFSGDWKQRLIQHPLWVVPLLLTAIQHHKFFIPEDCPAIENAISQCLTQGLQGCLSLLTIITESPDPTLSLEFLHKHEVLPHIIPLSWPPEAEFMRQWLEFMVLSLKQLKTRDPFVVFNYLMLAPYETLRKSGLKTPQSTLLDNMTESLLAQIQHLKRDEKRTLKNSLMTALPILITQFTQWQKENEAIFKQERETALPSQRKPIVFSPVVNFNASTPLLNDKIGIERRSCTP